MSVYKGQPANNVQRDYLLDKGTMPVESGIAIINQSGRFTFCDHSFLHLTGKSMQECRHLSLSDLFPGITLPQTTARVSQPLPYQGTAGFEITLSLLLDSDEQLSGATVLLKKMEPRHSIINPFEKILEVMPQLAWTSSPDGAVTYVNHKWAEYTGKRVEELLAWGWQPFFHPEDIERVLYHWKKSMQTGEKYECEYRFKKEPEGVYRWLLGRALPIRDEAGRITLWVGTSTDIHDQKTAEEILEKRIQERTNELSTAIEELNTTNEQLFQEIELRRKLDQVLEEQKSFTDKVTDLVPCLITVYNIHTGQYLYVNKAIESMLGYSQESVLEQGAALLVSLLHPDDAEDLMARNAEALQQANQRAAHEPEMVADFEYRLQHANGEWRWLHTSGTVFDRDAEGMVSHILNISIDITEKNETQAILQESRHLVEQITNATPNMIYIFDISTHKNLYANRSMEQMLGYTQDHMQQMGEHLFTAIVHPDDLAKMEKNVYHLQNLKEGEIFENQFRLKNAAGEWRWFQSREVAFKRDRQGKVIHILGSSQDITEVKLATEEIHSKTTIIEGILSRLPVLVTRIDKQGTILEAIGSGLHNLGLTDNQIAGVNVFQAYPHLSPYMEQVVQGKDITFIGTPERDGKKRYFLNNYFFDRDKDHAIGFSIDITEQKEAEEQLKESESRLILLNEELEKRVAERTRDLAISKERYEIASYVTHDAIWDWNLITNELTYSKGYTTIFGYHSNETLDTIEEWHRRIHPEDRDGIIASLQEVIEKKEQLWSREYRHLRKDGSYAHVFDRGYVQYDARNKPVRVVGAMADVTERKEAEKAILESEAKFRRIFESDMLGIFLWNINGVITEANDRFLQMIGYSSEELTSGKINWQHLTPPIYAPIDQQMIQQLLTAGTSSSYEKEYIRKDGSLIPIIIGGVLLQGNMQHGVAYVLDITEQKKAQQNLALSEERFRLVTRATNDAVRDWNLLTDVIWWNDGFKNMFGYKPEEIEVGPESWYSRIHPDDLESVLQKIHRVIENGEEQWSDEYRFRRADGSYAYILDRTYILHNEQGKAIRMLGSMVDVTYMKEIQEALEQQTAELRQSNADLEQFAFISSHDLQEPLNTAASFARLLEKKYKHVLDADGQEFINFIVTSTDRMKMLIRSLLNYSKINSIAKTYEPANLNDLAKAAIDNLQARIVQTQAQITLDTLPTLPVIAPHIVQLFQNLISNALKFKSELPPEIYISAKDQPEHVLFSVRDNGIGMDMKYAGKIFQVFQRLHSRDEYEGAGIGLATCKRIVERHHGNIWVESSPGKGSTFYFTLRK